MGDNGNVDYYVVGTDGAVWTKRFSATTGWSGWRSLGGKVLPGTGPSAVAVSGGRSVLVTGTDHDVWSKSAEGAPAPWRRTEIPGATASSPAAALVLHAQGGLLFVNRQADSHLLVSITSGDETDRVDLGGVLTSAPGVVGLEYPDGRLLQFDVMVRGTDNALWARSFNGASWSGWKRW